MLTSLRNHPYAQPLLVLLVGLLVSCLIAFLLWRVVHDKDAARFESQTQLALVDIQDRIGTYIALLRGGTGLMAANPQTTREQFRDYVEQLQLPEYYPGIQGIGWTARIAPEQRADYEAEQRRLSPGFRIWPEGQRDYYHAITFLEPMDRRNVAAIGYDMYTEPTRRLAMAQARDRGIPAASGKVELVQEIDPVKQSGFLIYLPVYAGHDEPATVSERRERLLGYVYSPFRAGDVFRGIFGPSDTRNLRIAIYDGAPKQDNLLYDSAEGRDGPAARYTKTAELTIGDRQWTVSFATLPPFDRGSSVSLVPVALLLGILASMIAAAITLGQTRAWIAAQHEIERREQAEAERAALLHELNHRVKNLLAMVQAIARQSLRSASSPEDFARDLDGRLRALANTHSLLTASNWEGATLRQVAEAELAPHASEEERRYTLSGPHVELSPRAALCLGMTLHELATNATKYGAMSTAQGRVDVAWRVTRNGAEERLKVDWQESGGPRVAPPRQTGFGSTLIRQGVAHQLQGKVDLDYLAGGVRCRIDVPLAAAMERSAEKAAPGPTEIDPEMQKNT
jgi:two-component sensor histidine kinase/CHASE1-domain containing sensor protein